MSEEPQRAGLLLRTVARAIDFVIIAAAVEVVPKAGFFAGLIYLLIGDGLLNGRSLGKKLIGIQVVSVDTFTPCTFRESIMRNCILVRLDFCCTDLNFRISHFIGEQK